MRTLMHISDLHFGRADVCVMAHVLKEILVRQPNMVVISGDLTQRARPVEFEAARAFIKALETAGISCFVIPGNHDIMPLYRPLSRSRRPFDRYRAHIAEVTEPVYADKYLAIAAIDTVRASTLKNGRISPGQIDRVSEWFFGVPDSVMKIVVTHHPLDLPEPHTRRKLVWRAKRAVYLLSESRVDMYLSGHYHQSSAVHTAARYTSEHYAAIAVQAGTVSHRLRGEQQSFNVIRIGKPEATIETFAWDSSARAFQAVSLKSFTCEEGRWREIPGAVPSALA